VVVCTNAGPVSVRVRSVVVVVVVAVVVAVVVVAVAVLVVEVTVADAVVLVVLDVLVVVDVVASGRRVRVVWVRVADEVRGCEEVAVAAELDDGLVVLLVLVVAPPPQPATVTTAASATASAATRLGGLIGTADGCHSQSRRAMDMVRRDGSESDGPWSSAGASALLYASSGVGCARLGTSPRVDVLLAVSNAVL
jgi:hypothetical protein